MDGTSARVIAAHDKGNSKVPSVTAPAPQFSRIDALVSFAKDQRLQWYLPGDSGLTIDGCSLLLSSTSKPGRTAIAQVLLEQLARGLTVRFGEDEPSAVEAFSAAETYRPTLLPAGIVDPVAAVEAALDFETDASQCESWDMSLAAWLIAGIMCRAAQMLARAEIERTHRGATSAGPADH